MAFDKLTKKLIGDKVNKNNGASQDQEQKKEEMHGSQASPQKLENLREVSLNADTSSPGALAELPPLTRCKEPRHYESEATPTQLQPLEFDEGHPLSSESTSPPDKLERQNTYDHGFDFGFDDSSAKGKEKIINASRKLPTHPGTIGLGIDFGFENKPIELSPKISTFEGKYDFPNVPSNSPGLPANNESTSLYDELENCHAYSDNRRGFDFGFDSPSPELSPKMSTIEGENDFPPVPLNLPGYPKRDEEAPLSPQGQLRRKAGKMGLNVNNTNSDQPSEKSIMADYSRSMELDSSAYLSSLTKEELDQIAVSFKGWASIDESHPHPFHGPSNETSSASDQIAEATPLHPDPKPPIPKKSSRRKLVLKPTLSASPDLTATGPQIPTIKVTPTSPAPTKQPPTPPHHRPRRIPPIQIRVTGQLLHPEVVVAESRISAYKSSPAYKQRALDLALINAHNQAKKFREEDHIEGEIEEEDDDKTIIAGKRSPPSPSSEARSTSRVNEAKARIVEMSLSGGFGAFLKDVRFVRVYREEMRVRAEEGVWWEGWKILEELGERGVVPSVEE